MAAPPLMTIRGREISEPTLWAVGGLVACFTPLTALALVPMLMIGTMAHNDLLGIGLTLAAFGLLTWWAHEHPGRLPSRIWAVGAWLAGFGLMFFGSTFVLGWLDNLIRFPEWFYTVITLAVGLAVVFVASPLWARAAFLLGQRWFAQAENPVPPVEMSPAA